MRDNTILFTLRIHRLHEMSYFLIRLERTVKEKGDFL